MLVISSLAIGIYGVYPSSFKLLLCWLLSLTPVTSLSMLLGIRSLAAVLQLEIYWVYYLINFDENPNVHSLNGWIIIIS
ncbi:Hypothetical Protein PAU_03376 [Photorhabdus asymbiotica]|uniref:Uncharacterized protein n=1 Tax=Photorhabdus asymbiotica subsp. asymbiotica (strain ATCC 43949 / 3105-77) TaxID=553480 RepID=B6VNR7_PHOAA|nr:Hypothetical Protein PAU_03376 [Photorhabdus asymbiotica]CAR67798.1 Hypothetical Protein PA-RVA20-21-0196 [Photorhabdus asymbiotica subsp. asymbiotica ATCC 43949]